MKFIRLNVGTYNFTTKCDICRSVGTQIGEQSFLNIIEFKRIGSHIPVELKLCDKCLEKFSKELRRYMNDQNILSCN